MSGRKVGVGFLKAAVCLLIVWSAVVYAHTATASTITIDSFNFPGDPQTGTPGTRFFVPGLPPWGSGNPFDHKDVGVAEVIGGERDTHVEVVGPAVPVSASGGIGYEPAYDAGLLRLATGGRDRAFVTVTYDGTDDLGLGGMDMDLTDGGSNDRFRLSFEILEPGVAATMELDIIIEGQGGGSSSEHVHIPESADPSVFEVPFVGFSDPGLLSSVKSISFVFNEPLAPLRPVDFELDKIEAVPEPSTIAMLSALGASMLLAGIWCRRRR